MFIHVLKNNLKSPTSISKKPPFQGSSLSNNCDGSKHAQLYVIRRIPNLVTGVDSFRYLDIEANE